MSLLKRFVCFALSLVAVLVGMAWYQSYRDMPLLFLTFRLHEYRYSLRDKRGYILLSRSPLTATGPQGASAAACAERLSNHGITWSIYVHFRSPDSDDFEVR